MKIKLYINRQRLNFFFLSLIISVIVGLIPWDKLNPRGYYIDRAQYFFAYDFKSYRLDGFEAENFYDYITNEWLWRFMNGYARNTLDLSPEVFFGAITIIAFATYSYFILDATKKPLVLLYLLNVEFITFIFSQLRLAFAMSVFIIAIEFFRRKYFLTSTIFFLTCLLIHTSMLIFIFLTLISFILSRLNISNIKKMTVIFLTGLMVNVLIGPLREVILSSVGDRRADYNDFSPPFYWFLIYVLYFIVILYKVFRYKLRFFDNYIYNYAFIIFSLITTSLVLGGYTSRFIVAATLFIVPSLFLLKGNIATIFHATFSAYLLFLWVGFFI